MRAAWSSITGRRYRLPRGAALGLPNDCYRWWVVGASEGDHGKLAKKRVHQLAKELGVPSKTVLRWLAEQGEFVKSASSTLEAPVANRLRAAHPVKYPGGAPGSPAKPQSKADPKSGPAKLSPAQKSARRRHFHAVMKAHILPRFRWASVTQQGPDVIERLYAEYAATYGVSREVLVNAVAADLRRNPSQYVSRRLIRNGKEVVPARDNGSLATAHASRPRTRVPSLPAIDGADLADALELVLDQEAGNQLDRDEVTACVQAFRPDASGGYGYLAWRYSAVKRHAYPDPPTPPALQDLATIEKVVGAEKQLVDNIIHAHSAGVLQQPAHAKRILEAEFSDIADGDDIGRSVADELRRLRAGLHFLRVAVVLVVADPGCDERLWEMLDRIRPPTPDQLVETNTSLESAIARFNDLIEEVEALLSSDEESLAAFFGQALTELGELHAGRYDFLHEFDDLGAQPPPDHRAVADLPFAVLPRGEQLRTFLSGLRSIGLYRGHQVDEQRVAVLEEVEAYFGADRCEWHEGTASSTGFDNHYVVLTVNSDNECHAVAVSPLAGEHATYIVRSDCTEEDWMTVLAQSKPAAREQGAHKFLFAGSDPYSSMRAKIIDALECSPQEFQKQGGRRTA